MMNRKYLALGCLLLAQAIVPAAYARTTISDLIVPFDRTISGLKLGNKGTLGAISLASEGLNGLPVVSAVLGTVTIAQGTNIVESVSALRGERLIEFPSGFKALLNPLPGLNLLKAGSR